MKKFLFPVAICAMALAMTSCDGYNDKQYEDLFPYGPNQHGEFTQGQTKNLNEAFGCNTNWTSPDPFVATVDGNGLMTAKHVGQTWIQGNAQANQYFGVTVKSTVNLFDNPAFDPNAVIGEGDLKSIGDKYGEVTAPVDNLTSIAYVAWNIEQKRENADGDEISYAKNLVNVYKKVTTPVLDEETGEPVVKDEKPVVEVSYQLLESNVVLNLAANGDLTEDTEALASQLTQWYEPINTVGTIPGLVVYNNYTVDTATMRVSVFGYSSTRPQMVFVNYAVASSTNTYSSAAYLQKAVAAIPNE